MTGSSIKTIEKSSSFEMKERGSRFIARAIPVKTRAEAENFIEQMKKKYFDATHNCFAYRIGTAQNEIIRFSDDGEPSGTAGKPILQAITTRGLTNICLVVTRYFGGIKLGTGGLIRAYGGAASQVLERAKTITEYSAKEIEIYYNYEYSNLVTHEIEKYKAKIVSKEYEQTVKLLISIRESFVEDFVSQLTDHSSGNIKIAIVS